MTLTEFIEEQRRGIEMFHLAYLKGNEISTFAYPLEMESGDWDEQLDLFRDEHYGI